MRQYLIIFAYSLYFFVTIGLFFHTSAHPQLFGKYELWYALLLLLLVIFYPLFIYILFFLGKSTKITFKKKKYTFYTHKKLLILFIVLMCILLPFEIYFRWKYAVYEQSSYTFTRNNFHPFLQFVPTASQKLHTNSYGFRADEISKQKPANTYRIFLLGGSTVFNEKIPYEQNVSKLLEQQLQKNYPQKHIEVINAGVNSYTSEHSLIEYLFSIKDFSPDMIIMWHGINDWYYSCSPPSVADGSFKSDYSHYLGLDASMVYEHFSPQPLVSLHSITVDRLWLFLKTNWFSDIVSRPGSLNIYTKKHPIKTYEMTSYPSLVSYKRNVQSLISATKADHVSLLLGDQPSLYKSSLSEKEQQVLSFPKVLCSKSDGSYPSLSSMITALHTFNNTTKAIAESNDIAFVDLDAALPKTLTYFLDDVHYTKQGNMKVAETLYDAIIAGNYISL